jgi:hypothetical protein
MGVQNLRLFLASELRMAHIKLMAKWGLDAEYVALRCLTENYYQNGVLSREERDFYVDRYSKPPTPSMPIQPHKVSFEEVKANQLLEEKKRYFEAVKSQWTLDHRPLASGKSWRQDVLEQAEQWADRLAVAAEVMRLGSQQFIVVENKKEVSL